MLARGVKRKRFCEERAAGKLSARQRQEMKQEVNAEERRGLPQDQQRLLSLCEEKLRRYQAGTEPGLHRSVLLLNTWRQIQQELAGAGPLSAPPMGAVVRCLCCAEGQDSSVQAPPPSYEKGKVPRPARPPPRPPQNSFWEAESAVGYLTDAALNDIFDDIDTSMYDSSEPLLPWATASFWPVSVFFLGNEDSKMSACDAATLGALQPHQLDLNELDHIMETLVES